jgi:glycosyltransferase involved in cell wall biosynthesis
MSQKVKSLSLSKRLQYNPVVFETLKSKCERETKFGKLANLLFYFLYHAVRAAKAVRQTNQTQVMGRLFGFFNPKVRDSTSLDQPAAPWHYSLSKEAIALGSNQQVLIVAELSIPQCKRYRVDQKVAALKALGRKVEVISFTDEQACLRNLPFSGLVIFYRTPYWPPVKRLIDECTRLGIPSVYDTDDLVFDVNEYRKHPKLQEMKKDEREGFLRGAESYGKCLAACDHAIASTHALAEWMGHYNTGNVFVIENAFDELSIRTLEYAESRPRRQRKEVIIGYGSGTRSHDHDFQLVSKALVRILNQFPDVRLVIHGYLNLDGKFDQFSSRITRIPFLPAEAYLQSVADFDISLAPLETSVFNDAKSNIKFIEAALVGVPTVASPSKTMASSIEHGKNGFLATTSDEWYDAIRRLVESSNLRIEIGSEAKARAWKQYRPEATQERLKAVLESIPKLSALREGTAADRPRVLAVNVFYSPFSFGGATVLLEKVMRQLEGKADLAVFTCNQLPELPEYAVFKYEADKSLVYSCKVEGVTLQKSEIHHPELARTFENVLFDYQPDIVHFHAIQGMGVELLEAAKRFGAKVVVTAHDAWWICARQFMMKEDKTWCGQSQIDLRVCAACTKRPGNTYDRSLVMNKALDGVDLVLSPSMYHKQIMDLNLPKSVKVQVNKNGVDHPQALVDRRAKTGTDIIRFAFIGGLGADHKGYDIVMEAFQRTSFTNFELHLVDLHQKLGHPASHVSQSGFRGKVVVVPPFDHTNASEFYSKIDVLIAPSRIPESFGIAVREAVLNGCHVVVSRMGGVVEDLEGVPGVHFLDSITTESLLAIVEPILTKGLSVIGRESYPKIADPQHQADELLGFYKDLLQ